MPTLICQKWEESERGWGTRPDGYSLHVGLDALAAYKKACWDRMPPDAPDEYSRTDGEPYECPVTDALVAEVTAAGGNKLYSGSAPWPTRTGGWTSAHPPRLDKECPTCWEKGTIPCLACEGWGDFGGSRPRICYRCGGSKVVSCPKNCRFTHEGVGA